MPIAALIVDDDADIRELLRALLEDEGYTVAEARHGEEALRILRESPQRFVVLLDLRMPVLDGVGVINALTRERSLRRHSYILATADNRTLPLAFAQQLLSLEIPVLAKPFETHRLIALIDAIAARLKEEEEEEED